MGNQNSYDMILTTKLDLQWDEDRISKLGKTITDLSGKVDLTKFDEKQQQELKEAGILSVQDLFTEKRDTAGNIMYEFSDSIRQLGSSALPGIIREIQSFGRALTDITRESRALNTETEASIKTATAYRTLVNSGGLIKNMSSMQFGTENAKALYGDIVRFVNRRFEVLSKGENTASSREIWANRLTNDATLRKQIDLLQQRSNRQLGGEEEVSHLIRNAVMSLGSRSLIRNQTASGTDIAYAPLYQATKQQNTPNDILRNRAIRDLYERNGTLGETTYVKDPKEQEMAHAKGLYSTIKRLQQKGNRVAQSLALETGLATIDNMSEEEASEFGHNKGLVLRWNENPERARILKFLGRAVEEGRKIRRGQAIFEHDADKNNNINNAFKEILEITDAFADRANLEGGEEFAKRFIEPASKDIDLSKLRTPKFGKTITSIQNTTGKIPSYGIPYTTLTTDEKGNLVFIPRDKQDMQKVVRKTSDLKVKEKDKGIMIQNSQLTALAGIDPRNAGSFGVGFDENGAVLPEHPAIIAMPIGNMWERDDEGYLKSGKERRLTDAGKMQVAAINNGASYNGKKYRYVYTNGESATFLDEELYYQRIAEAKKRGLSNPFEGFDPTIAGMIAYGSNGEQDLSKTNKMIMSAKRMGTQGNALADMYPELAPKLQKMRYAAIDLNAQNWINKELGLQFRADATRELVDGAGLIDPSLSPISSQIRGLGEGLKGVLGNYDWRDFLRKTVKKTDKASASPYMGFDEKGLLNKLYMPSVSFGKLTEEAQKSILSAIEKNTTYQDKNRESLLGEYFTDIMDESIGALITDGMLKGPSQMTAMTPEQYLAFLTDDKNATWLQPKGSNTSKGYSKDVAEEMLKAKRKYGMTFKGKTIDEQGKEIEQEFIRLNAHETNANIATSLDFGRGLFSVKTDEDFSTGKRYIGRQLAEAIGFSAAQRERSAQLYANLLSQMESDEYWINNDQFSQRSDLHNQFMQSEDKSDFIKTNKQAQAYIKSQKDALRKKSMTHYMLENNSATRLAFPMLGTFFEDLILGQGAEINKDSDLAWTYRSMLQDKDYLKNRFKFTDEDLEKVSTDGQIDLQKIMFSPGANQLWSIAGRTPSALNTFSRMLNLSYRNKEKKMPGASLSGVTGGGHNEVAMMLPEGIYRMNTGDFDGDTVWMYSHLKEQMTEQMIRNMEAANANAIMDDETQKEIDAMLEQQMKAIKNRKVAPDFGHRVSEEIYNYISGQGEMGKASAIMRNALDLYNLKTDKGKRKFMKAYNLGSASYDKATSEGQNMGWVGDYTHEYGKAAYLAGRQFDRFKKQVGEHYLSGDEGETGPSIFKNRLISLNNVLGMADAVGAGQLRKQIGADFGFGDMVDEWITDAYGIGSEGHNQELYKIASEWGRILKGQSDLSYLASNDEISEFLKRSILTLQTEQTRIGEKNQDSAEYIRIKKELGNLKSLQNKMSKGSANGGLRDTILTSDNLSRMAASFPEDSEEAKFYGRAKMIADTMPTVDSIIADTEHEELIGKYLEEAQSEKEARQSFSNSTAKGFIELWKDRLGDKNPSVTAIEPYIKNVTPLYVRKQRYNENGELLRDNNARIAPNLWNEDYQAKGIANEMRTAQGAERLSDVNTLLGSFIHDVFKTVSNNAEMNREDAENPIYEQGTFLKTAKELWDSGKVTVGRGNAKQDITWKEYFTGNNPFEKLEDALSEEDWKVISDYLADPSNPEILNKTKIAPIVTGKLKDIFTKKGNPNDYFLRDLFRSGRVFEAENEIYDPVEKIFKSAYKNTQVRDPLSNKESDLTYFRPDLIWERNADNSGNRWLDMYDWKPDETGAGKSIYQMIQYAKQAEAESLKAYNKRDNGNLTADEKRWLKFRDEEGNFRIRNLVGKDYTGRGSDIVLDYQAAENQPLIESVMKDFKNARQLYQYDRNSGGLFKGFELMYNSGLINPDEEISGAWAKYIGAGKTYANIADSIKEYRSNHVTGKDENGNDIFSGQQFIENRSQEWNYLVAKQAQNREKLDEMIESIRGQASKYKKSATKDREYSQFDFMYDDLSKLKDPELIAALSSVYQDVLPYAIQDIGKYEDERKGQEAFLNTIIDTAALQDPLMAAEAMKRKMYGSTGNNVFDQVQKVIGKANLAAGTRQTYKKPFESFFNMFDSEDDPKATALWEEAARIKTEYDKYDAADNSEEAIKAREAYDRFIKERLMGQYEFDKPNKNGETLSSAQFMANAAKYASAQGNIDKLRAAEREYINKLYEDDRNQTLNDVMSLTGQDKDPLAKAQQINDKKAQDINNYIASSKMDIAQVDSNVEDKINTLSREFLKGNKEKIKSAVESSDIKALDDIIKSSGQDDANVLEEIKNLMLKKETLNEAISKLDEYLGNEYKAFTEENIDKANTTKTKQRYETVSSASMLLDSLRLTKLPEATKTDNTPPPPPPPPKETEKPPVSPSPSVQQQPQAAPIKMPEKSTLIALPGAGETSFASEEERQAFLKDQQLARQSEIDKSIAQQREPLIQQEAKNLEAFQEQEKIKFNEEQQRLVQQREAERAAVQSYNASENTRYEQESKTYAEAKKAYDETQAQYDIQYKDYENKHKAWEEQKATEDAARAKYEQQLAAYNAQEERIANPRTEYDYNATLPVDQMARSENAAKEYRAAVNAAEQQKAAAKEKYDAEIANINAKSEENLKPITDQIEQNKAAKRNIEQQRDTLKAQGLIDVDETEFNRILHSLRSDEEIDAELEQTKQGILEQGRLGEKETEAYLTHEANRITAESIPISLLKPQPVYDFENYDSDEERRYFEEKSLRYSGDDVRENYYRRENLNAIQAVRGLRESFTHEKSILHDADEQKKSVWDQANIDAKRHPFKKADILAKARARQREIDTEAQNQINANKEENADVLAALPSENAVHEYYNNIRDLMKRDPKAWLEDMDARHEANMQAVHGAYDEMDRIETSIDEPTAEQQSAIREAEKKAAEEKTRNAETRRDVDKKRKATWQNATEENDRRLQTSISLQQQSESLDSDLSRLDLQKREVEGQAERERIKAKDAYEKSLKAIPQVPAEPSYTFDEVGMIASLKSGALSLIEQLPAEKRNEMLKAFNETDSSSLKGIFNQINSGSEIGKIFGEAGSSSGNDELRALVNKEARTITEERTLTKPEEFVSTLGAEPQAPAKPEIIEPEAPKPLALKQVPEEYRPQQYGMPGADYQQDLRAMIFDIDSGVVPEPKNNYERELQQAAQRILDQTMGNVVAAMQATEAEVPLDSSKIIKENPQTFSGPSGPNNPPPSDDKLDKELAQSLSYQTEVDEKLARDAQYKTDMERYETRNKIRELKALNPEEGSLEDKLLKDLTTYDENEDYWKNRVQYHTDETLANRQRQVDLQNERIGNTMFQNAMQERSMSHQYELQKQNRFRSNSALINGYRQGKEQNFQLETTALNLSQKITNKESEIGRLKLDYEKAKTPEEKTKIAGSIANAQQELEGYKKSLAATQEQMKSFDGAQGMMAAGLNKVSSVISNVAKRFGRQLFYKAINEAKRFVKEFDASMTTIQMITLKSDTEMSKLGDGLISKAKDLKVSIGEVTKAAEILYRQGLSDEEVNSRLETITKFSKVSGAKAEDATKLITVAMNTGLVTDANQAADIVTALGDNAATNAQQIEKGIEKAGAAAAADGTSFGELAAMLTAITSTTQIGGNVAGRTLNTIIGRMNKIGTNEIIYDENGNAISGSAVSQLLSAQGIKTYDENGNKRSTYDVLYDLSQKWEGMSDAKQQQLATALAGTRQYSNFAAIMQGMSEGKVDEYMDLIGESSGITDKKYEAYTKSLQAALDSLKTTFDSVINDLVDSGAMEDIIDSISTMIRGVGNLVKGIGNLKTALPVLLAIVGAIKGATIGGGIGALIGAATGAAGGSLIMSMGQENESINVKTPTFDEKMAKYDEDYAYAEADLNRAEELKKKGKNRTEEESKEYSELISKIAKRYDLEDPTKMEANVSRAIELQKKGNNRTLAEETEYTNLMANLSNTFDLSDPTQSIDEFTDAMGDLGSSTSIAAQIAANYNNIIEEGNKKEAERRAIETIGNKGTLTAEIGKNIENINAENNLFEDRFSTYGGGFYAKGFNNYLEYTHSTEAEIVKTAGIIGQGVALAEEALGAISSEQKEKYQHDIVEQEDRYKEVGAVFANAMNFYRNLTPEEIEANSEYKAAYEYLEKNGYLGLNKQNWADAFSGGFFREDFRVSDELASAVNLALPSFSASSYDLTKEYVKTKLRNFINNLMPDLDTGTVNKLVNQGFKDFWSSYTSGDTATASANKVFESMFHLSTNGTDLEKIKESAYTYIGQGPQDEEQGPTGKIVYYDSKLLTNGSLITTEKGRHLTDNDTLNGNVMVQDNLAYWEADDGQRYNIIRRENDQFETEYYYTDENGNEHKLTYAGAGNDTTRYSEKLEEGGFRTGRIYQKGAYIYRPGTTDEEAASAYGLDTNEEYDYYIDKNGNIISRDEAIQTYIKNTEQNKINAAVMAQKAYDYNQDVISDAYASSIPTISGLLANIYSSDYSSGTAIGQKFEETIRNKLTANPLKAAEITEKLKSGTLTVDDIIDFLPTDEELSKIDTYGESDAYAEIGEESPEKVKAFLESSISRLATDSNFINEVNDIPDIEFPAEQLIGGANLTVEAIQDLLENGSDILKGTALQVKNMTKEIPELEGYHDVFKDSVTEAYGTWATSNTKGLASDTISRLISSGNYSGPEGLNNLVSDIKRDKTYQAAWKNFTVDNEDFNRIANQITFNEETQQWEGPEDIVDQLLHIALKNSISYGSANISTTQKAASARAAYEGLVSGNAFVSEEERSQARTSAWADYTKTNERYKEYQENLDNINASTIYTGAQKQQLRDELAAAYSDVYATRTDFLNAEENAYLNSAFISPEQETYLTEILGSNLAQKVLLTPDKLSPDETKYINAVLTNRMYGMEGLTTSQTLEGIKDVRAAIASGNLSEYNEDIAKSYMSGWSGWTTYSALKKKSETENLSSDELKTLETLENSLNTYERNLSFSIEVENIKSLEEAGELLDGTATTIEKLKKGGRFAIEAEINIHTNVSKQDQLVKQLNSTNEDERREAILQLTGMDIATYDANPELAADLAQRYAESQMSGYASELALARDEQENPEAFDDIYKNYGFTWISDSNDYMPIETGEDFDIIDGQVYREDRENGWVLDEKETKRYQNAGHYEYNPGNVKRISALKYREKSFLDNEVSNAVYDLVYGNKTEEQLQNENPDLYNAAINAMTEEQKRVLEGNGEYEKIAKLQADNTKRKNDIEYNIKGIKELEEAGELLEGTSELIEKIKKGGKFEIEARVKITSDLFQESQLDAMLNSGNDYLIDKAVQQITGVTGQAYYENRDQLIADAKEQQDINREQTANSLLQQYNVAAAQGKGQEFLDRLVGTGWSANYNEFGGVTGFVNNPQDYKYDNPYVGKEKEYTSAELARMRQQIINGELSESDIGYEAAFTSGGAKWKEYQRLLTDKNATEEEIQFAAAEMRKEEAIALQEASDQEVLEAARLNASTTGGALTYAQLQYEQNNRASSAATEMYLGLKTEDIQNFEDLSRVINGIDVTNWKALITSSDSLRKTFTDLGVTIAEDGSIDFSSLENSSVDASTVLEILAEAAANASNELNKYSDVLTTGETYQRATDYLSGNFITEEEEKKGFEALSQVTGNSSLAQYVRNGLFNFQKGINVEGIDKERGDKYQNGKWINGETGEVIAAFDPYAGLSDYNKEYAQMKIENMQYGIDNLTDMQRYTGLESVMAAVNRGGNNGVRQFYQQDTLGAFNDFTSGMENAQTWLAASMELESLGYKMTDLSSLNETSEGYADIVAVVQKYYGTMHNAIEASDDFQKELINTRNRAMQPFGKETENIINKGKQLRGSIKDQNSALKTYRNTLKDLMNNQYLRNMFRSGKVNDDVKSYIEGLGFDQKDATNKAMRDQILEAMRLDELSDSSLYTEEIAAAFGAMQDSFNDYVANNPIYIDGLEVGVGSGNITVSTEALLANFREALDETQMALINDALARGVEVYWNVSWQNGKTSIVPSVSNLGTGRRTSKSSGGGKSKLDSILEGQAHYNKAREHDINMIQSKETHYENMNDYQNYVYALDEEVDAQERYREQLKANNDELEKHLATLKEGTEEWYKTKEAIESNEETLADIDNKITDINGKKITILETKQSNEDKPFSHATTMLGLKAKNYLGKGDFESYAALTQKQIDNYKNDIALNNAQIEEWEELLTVYEEGDKNWMAVRDKIWAIKEENAELENRALEDQQSLYQSRISQIATDLQNSLTPITHEQNMLGTWGNIYRTSERWDDYRNTLFENNAYSSESAIYYSNALAKVQEEMSTLQEGTEAWYLARNAIFEYEEALANVTYSIQENNEAIAESYITQLKQDYQDASADITHELKMVQFEATSFKADNDNVNYLERLRTQYDLTGESIDIMENSLAEMEARLTDGSVPKGTQAYRTLKNEILSMRETIASTKNEYEDLGRTILQTSFENVKDNYNDKNELLQHEIKTIQYQQTRYQNAGELTNYGTMLKLEKSKREEERDLISGYIDDLNAELEKNEVGSAIYESITSEIYKMEEAYMSTNNTIEKLSDTIQKNELAILKTRKTVEDEIDKEIRNRIQEEKNMMNARVSLENSILDVIKKNKQAEWDLEKKTIEKKKQALQDEKNLLNERLNARKDAINKEEKYEELAELKRQLALIRADSSRTKEAKELAKKIEDIEKDLAMTIATEQVEAQSKSLDDQIKAWSDYESNYEEELNEMLKDANNFREKLDDLLAGDVEDFLAFMKENNEDYKNSTAETQKQMEQNWTDTFKTFKNMPDTFWDEVEEIMKSRDSFVEYMKASTQYEKKASDTEREILVRQWEEMYDDYIAAYQDNAEWNDNHEIIDKIDEMKDWTYKVKLDGINGSEYGSYVSQLTYQYLRNGSIDPEALDYTGYDVHTFDSEGNIITGSKASEYEAQQQSSTPMVIVNVSGGGGGGYNPTPDASTNAQTEKFKVYGTNASGSKTKTSTDYDTEAQAKSAANKALQNGWTNVYYVYPSGKTSYVIPSIMRAASNGRTQFLEGGLVDFTGPAWVDGTKTKPEAFLSATDTENIRAMLDAFDYVRVNPYMSNIDTSKYGNDYNFGDVNVTINEAQINNDQDVNELAKKIGKAFTKELSKSGINSHAYAW